MNESCSAPLHDPTTLTLPPSCSNWKPEPLAAGEPLSDGEPLSVPVLAAGLLEAPVPPVPADAPVPLDAPPELLLLHAVAASAIAAHAANARIPGRSRWSMRSSCSVPGGAQAAGPG